MESIWEWASTVLEGIWHGTGLQGWCKYAFWVPDCFAQLSKKMGCIVKTVRVVGRYYNEPKKLCGLILNIWSGFGRRTEWTIGIVNYSLCVLSLALLPFLSSTTVRAWSCRALKNCMEHTLWISASNARVWTHRRQPFPNMDLQNVNMHLH